MPRFFNTAGLCQPEEHYMLPPERRAVEREAHETLGTCEPR